MKLLQPGRIGTLEIKNRVVMAAMGVRGLCDADGDWGERFRAYYAARAAGGVGLISTEMAFVSPDLEPLARGLFSFASPKHLVSLRRLTDRLHSFGCKLSVQLTAGFGRVVPPYVVPDDVRPVSASENPNFYAPDYAGLNSRALATGEVAALTGAFGSAAERCREAGVDCVELHGHEGYLMDQFMTGLWNRRTDRYGGSPDKRLTFARETITAIRQNAGADFPIIYRVGLVHHLAGGREEAEGLWIVQELEKMGVDALHIDAGCYESGWWPHPPQYQQPGCMVDMAAKTKRVVAVPVIAVGKLHYPEIAEQVLQEGKADFIAIGRGLLSEPEWVNKIARGKSAELRPCIGCHEGCLWQMIAGEPTSCALHPLTGHETEWQLTPLTAKRSLLVVGGGPAGIEAARAASERGFDVTLWEAGDRLGGNLWPASRHPFKRDIADYLTFITGQAERLPITIRLHTVATADTIREFGADYVVLATGARMEPLPFAGDNVVNLLQVLNGQALPGATVLIMGAGVSGCETAVYLAHQGRQVLLCARSDADELDTDIVDLHNRAMLLRMVAHPNITVHRATIPVRIDGRHVIADCKTGSVTLEADSLVFAGRLLPVQDLSQALRDDDHVFSIGDCTQTGTIMDAVWGGFQAVRTIEP